MPRSLYDPANRVEWEIDPDAVEQAKALLGIKLPIRFIERYGDFSLGCGCSGCSAATATIKEGVALISELRPGGDPVETENAVVSVALGRMGGYHPEGSNLKLMRGPIRGHEIWVSTAIVAAEANETLWHELTHAAQCERDGTSWESFVARQMAEERIDYAERPKEVEARHNADLYASRLMLLREKGRR